jgi:cell shape-determining protein MreC
MPRRLRFPEGAPRRFLLALGIVLPFVLYAGARTLPFTRQRIMKEEARLVRITSRAGEAFRYVLFDEALEENELNMYRQQVAALTEELATLRSTDVGPVRTLPVQVLARAYRGDRGEVLVWKAEGDPFVMGEGVGAGKILFGMIIEVKNDLAVVQTITHEKSAIPAMISGKETTIGIAMGTGGAWIEFSYVPKESDVAVGDTLVTSGLGGGVTRGLVLGTIREVMDADPSPFYRIKVEPMIYSDAWWEGEVFHFPVL